MRAVLERPLAQAWVAACACALLLSRPWLWQVAPHRAAVAGLFVVLGAVGLMWPTDGRTVPVRRSLPVTAMVATAGIVLFGVGRIIEGGQAPTGAVSGSVVLSVLAAVAEEAFFRRFLYQFLTRGGPLLAVLASATCFALVHVGVYGPAVLPVDLAAGLLLSWQRWASGSWAAPAVTHAFANLVTLY